MKEVQFRDLTSIGVNALTGEACAFSMRLLCDLNEDGCTLVQEYFGLACDQGVGLAKNWNSQVGDKPAVASIMLHRNMIHDLVLFALFREGYPCVVQTSCGMHGYEEGNEYLARYLEWAPDQWASMPGWALHRNPRIPAQPSVGTRNVHAFTGRVE